MDLKTNNITGAQHVTYEDVQLLIKNAGIVSKDNEKCSICMYEFEREDQNIVLLSDCIGHFFHDECISNCRQGKEFVKCPNCMKVYGVQTGNMPSGTMTVVKRSGRVPGFNCKNYFEIGYNIQGTTIGSTHYPGTSRTAYLPDTSEGNRALTLLTMAFHRGLTFVPGTSITNGSNGVIWAIHHKTSLSRGEYGYPDPTYLQRLTEELEARGVKFN